jgi:hypothetical protein
MRRIAFFMKYHFRHFFSLSILFLTIIVIPFFPQATGIDADHPRETLSLPEKSKVYGEYGLWVAINANEVLVHWMTMQTDSGFLEVLSNDAVIYSFKTPVGLAHRAVFVRETDQDIKIRYGGLGVPSDRHETILYFSETEKNREVQFEKVDSIFVVGDVHGEYERLIQLLTNAGLLHADLTWRARRAQIVFMGDIFDRGQDVIKTLWFLYRIEREVRARGGRMHILLGNHEIMTFLNDLRYTAEKETLIARYHNTDYTTMFDVKHSILGRWLASKPGMIKINNILFAHGGVGSTFSVHSLRSFNDSLYAYLHEDEFPRLLEDSVSTVRGNATLYARRLYFFFGENSPFWHRGYILSDTLKDDLKKTLDKFDARYHVVAHTPGPNIRTFYNGKIFAVDLHKPASEMLLFVRLTRRYRYYRFVLEGKAVPL